MFDTTLLQWDKDKCRIPPKQANIVLKKSEIDKDNVYASEMAEKKLHDCKKCHIDHIDN